MLRRSYIKRKTPRNAPTAADKAFWSRIPDGCQLCHAPESVVHHLMASVAGKNGRRDHRWVVKLCPGHHNMNTDSVHLLGSERRFYEVHGVDLIAVAACNKAYYDG